MFFVYGTREKLKKDVPLGMDYCPVCCKYTAHFAGRHRKIWHFDYIPLYMKTLEYVRFCGACEKGILIQKEEFEQRKLDCLPFKDKKQQITCYQEAEALARTMPYSEASVNTMMQQLSAKYPITATPFLESEYRRRFADMLQRFGIQQNPNQP